MSDAMIERIKTFIASHQLLRHDAHYLVAVSGGADSVCLLLVLSELGFMVEAVHCNFNLRGDESRRDEEFVKQLCLDRGIALHLAHFDTRSYAQLHKVSIEMAARTLRYAYFEQLRQDMGFDDICVAHHRDDSVETILINLIRGTGLHGLTGIKARNGHVVRPLLCVGRKDILSWLAKQGQTYVTDSTNLECDVVRNKLRLQVLPLLEDAHPGAASNILSTASHLAQASLVYDNAIENVLSDIMSNGRIPIDRLLSQPSPESLLFHWLHHIGFNPDVIEDISSNLFNAPAGKVWMSETHVVTFHQGHLCCQLKPKPMEAIVIPETGTYVIGEQRLCVSMADGRQVVKQPASVSLDADIVNFPLTLRRVMEGDRFHPYGMKGSKLVSDYLAERKVNVIDRQSQMVVCDSSGSIVWLAGHRADERFAVTTDTTKTLLISLKSEKVKN